MIRWRRGNGERCVGSESLLDRLTVIESLPSFACKVLIGRSSAKAADGDLADYFRYGSLPDGQEFSPNGLVACMVGGGVIDPTHSAPPTRTK